jgi:hypothetical protein
VMGNYYSDRINCHIRCPVGSWASILARPLLVQHNIPLLLPKPRRQEDGITQTNAKAIHGDVEHPLTTALNKSCGTVVMPNAQKRRRATEAPTKAGLRSQLNHSASRVIRASCCRRPPVKVHALVGMVSDVSFRSASIFIRLKSF